MAKRTVPFYGNTADDLHCYEASLRMVLKYFQPDMDYTWEELDRITGKTPGLWTWPQQGLIWLQDHGFQIVNIELFDYRRFYTEGETYLREFYGQEAAQEQKKHSNLVKEQQTCKIFTQRVSTETRLPSWQDIRSFLDQGYILGCSVNSAALNGEDGYIGHFIVIIAVTDKRIIFHDPGLPPQEAREVDLLSFEKAWAYPDQKARNIVAIKRFNE